MDKTTEAKINRLIGLYALSEKDLEAAILAYGLDAETLLAEANLIIDALDEKVRNRIFEVVKRVVTYETRLAERRIKGSKLVVSKEMFQAISNGFYSTFAQQHEEIRKAVTETIETG